MNLQTQSSQNFPSLGDRQRHYSCVKAPTFSKSFPSRQRQDRLVCDSPWLKLVVTGVVLASGFSFAYGAVLLTKAWTTGIGRVAGIEGVFRR